MAPKDNRSSDVNDLAEKDFQVSAVISSVPIGPSERARAQYPKPREKEGQNPPRRTPTPE